MSRNFNNWRKPRGSRGSSWGASNQQRRGVPPGLRGKQIGLYFRDSFKQKRAEKLLINLTIPTHIMTAVENNLSLITKIATRSNIDLPNIDNFKVITEVIDLTEDSDSKKIKVEKEPVQMQGDGVQNSKKNKSDPNTSDFIPISTKELVWDTSTDECLSNLTESSDSKKIKVEKEPVQMQKDGAQNRKKIKSEPNTSDFIPISTEEPEWDTSTPKSLSLRQTRDYKYGYEDIITGTFDEKLDECLSKGVTINLVNDETHNLNATLYKEYEDRVLRIRYKDMLQFRQKLPAYVKSKEIYDSINNNQVIVISGETGCGKSTQVPQIILDEAICAKKGANVKILVTQPRRIAASSLAMRVTKERDENLGHSVGYAVRLEKVDERSRGSIRYCTTGILLAELEVNQSLSNYSHIILDEVHERDVHVDLSMCMLKQVLKKRKDLKLILMSATIDADTLSQYFDGCPLLHIEGLAYPVQDIYLEQILEITKYNLPPEKQKAHFPKWMKYARRNTSDPMEKDIKYKAEIGPWLESIKRGLSYEVYKTLQDSRIEELPLDLIVELLQHICEKEQQGAILVFLPGIGEITKLMSLMENSQCFPHSRFEIYPLHSKLATLEQHKIFERPPGHIRKIIIATNIAETSITIDDVVYVVDCGKIKINGLNVETNISTLSTEWVAQANLRQRRGRAGRCQPGICYHLLTSYRAGKIPERLLPELQRSNLLEPVLMIKKLRLGIAADALKMVPSPPAETTINWAVQHLQRCGALNKKETLTPLGWHLARLPVHPAAGKLLLLGALFGCLDRAASVAAVWGFKDPFQLVIGKEQEVDRAKRKLALGEPSDHIAISEAIIKWEECGERQRRAFAYENFLSNNTLQLLSEMKNQFGDNLMQMGFLPSGNVKYSYENRNSSNLSLFKAIVAASLYPNIAHVKWSNLDHRRKPPKFVARSPEDGKLNVHPNSVMSGPRFARGGGIGMKLCDNPGANWLVYWLKQRSSELFIFDVTFIYTLPLLFFGEFIVTDDAEDPESCIVSILDVKVRCRRDGASKLFELRCLLDKVLATKITHTFNHSTQHNEFEEQVLNTVIQLITAEDEKAEYLGDFQDSDSSGSESDRHY
ncbi:ATP-dependent DNA/RNA helicase DHX36-like [Maniola hyperantus]|uniref:ATP-dependent DNA/RNA helicase DHX36-like n=1 Tax=Aphantopus hyperantus TaxID=2795564 RepID=UPI001568F947|nr:ATP-dependent DNA/RNA helicase DHX36-like [Maniola hyperantus]